MEPVEGPAAERQFEGRVLRWAAWFFVVFAWVSILGGLGKIYSALSRPDTHPMDLACLGALRGLCCGAGMLFLGMGLRQERRWAFRLSTAWLFTYTVGLLLDAPMAFHIGQALVSFFVKKFSAHPGILRILGGLGIVLLLFVLAPAFMLVFLGRPSVRSRLKCKDLAGGPGHGVPWPLLVVLVTLVDQCFSQLIPTSTGLCIFGRQFQGLDAWIANTSELLIYACAAKDIFSGTRRGWAWALVLCAFGTASAWFNFQMLGGATSLGYGAYAALYQRMGINFGDLFDSNTIFLMFRIRWAAYLAFILGGAWWVLRDNRKRAGGASGTLNSNSSE